ncbi:hypothetical protein BM221_010111 [Beauveria bassiana]|uniref:AA1-like domain-containing protein n=1 Tax=Beauveria bassiana TaxID=176275 RepID=A0A2N6N9N0_BEABA|nr:hypothetical protein BM221_010111 [Beauveria bassiana]
MLSILLGLLALAPATTLAYRGEPKDGVWDVQRLKQQFHVNVRDENSPTRVAFDSFCTTLLVGGDWQKCGSEVPYSPNGGFAKIGNFDNTTKTADVWFSWIFREDGKNVNATGRMVVESPKYWDVAKCRQMVVVSKEFV